MELLNNTGSALSVNKRGQLSVSLKFGSALAEPVVCVILSQYQAVITLDANGQVGFHQ